MARFFKLGRTKADVVWSGEIRDGVPEYVDLTIHLKDREVEVQIERGRVSRVTFIGDIHTTHLRIALDTLVHEVLLRAAAEPAGDEEYVRRWRIRKSPTSETKSTAKQAKDRHHEVAELYLAGEYDAVAEHFSRSPRTTMSHVTKQGTQDTNYRGDPVAGRRANREGTVTKRPDGKYQGRIRYIDPVTGKPKRTSVYGKTSAECRAKLKAIAERLEQGSPARDSKQGVGD